jgi:anti-anti-sigma factor
MDGVLTVTLTGRLAASETPRVADAFARAVDAGERRILLDVQGLDYVSSAGILAIEATAARLRSGGGTLEIRGAAGAVKIAMGLAGLDAN